MTEDSRKARTQNLQDCCDPLKWLFTIRSRHAATELGIMIGAGVGAVVAVPFLYSHRSDAIWLGSIAAFVAVPLLLGILLSRTTRFTIVIAAVLLVACPFVYFALDPWEELRDSVFLATGSILTFVTAAWTTHFLRVRRWARASAVGLLLSCSVTSVCIMIWIFMYLE